jgi:hypothetical protein
MKPKRKPDPDGGYYELGKDGKYYYHAPDPYREYRKDEMDPEVYAVLNRARDERGVHPSKAFIDAVIAWQNEKSPSMAIKYIKYKYLGECTYMQVYGREGKEAFHYEQTEKLIKEVESLQQQVFQMQKILINMAKDQQHKHMEKRTG